MDANVHQVHIAVKPACAPSGMEAAALPVHDMHMPPRAKRKPRIKTPAPALYTVTFMRAWRKHKGKTLEEMGAKCGKNHGQLSKIEVGRQPYSQPILEVYAKELGCTVIDLLSRPPGEAENVLSWWSRLNSKDRKRFETFAKSDPE